MLGKKEGNETDTKTPTGAWDVSDTQTGQRSGGGGGGRALATVCCLVTRCLHRPLSAADEQEMAPSV